MYFDHSPPSDDSSDDSFYQRKNITIKLKDLAINNPKHHEKKNNNENNQYVMSSYNELAAAVEKEKVKSLLTKGNSTMRRKPPPPPSLTPPPSFIEQSENIDTKIVLNRMTKKNIEPTKRRVMERVDYSPLTSPENIRFARYPHLLPSFNSFDSFQLSCRENISKLLKQHNSHQSTFVREIPPVQKPPPTRDPPLTTRLTEFNQLEQPVVPRLIPRSLPVEGHVPNSIPHSQFFPNRISKLEEEATRWRKQFQKYRESTLEIDEISQRFRECNSIESLATFLPSISAIFRQSFNLHSMHCYALGGPNDHPFSSSSLPEYYRFFQEVESVTNENVSYLDVEKILPIFSRLQDHRGIYRIVHSSEDRFSELIKLLHPKGGDLENSTIYCLAFASEEEIESNQDQQYPTSFFFFILLDEPSLSSLSDHELKNEDMSSLSQHFIQESFRIMRSCIEFTLQRIQAQHQIDEMKQRERELLVENEIRKYLQQTHSDFIQEETEEQMDRKSMQSKLESLLFSLTQIPAKYFGCHSSWLILQKHLSGSETSIPQSSSASSLSHGAPPGNGSTSLFHIFDSTGACHVQSENYLTLYERYPSHLLVSNQDHHHHHSPIGKLVLGAGLSEQNIAKPAVITTSFEKLASIGLVTTTTPLEGEDSTIQLLVVPFALSELDAMTDYSAFVVVLPQSTTMSNLLSQDFILEQVDFILEMLLKCISHARNHSHQHITQNISRSCDDLIQNIFTTDSNNSNSNSVIIHSSSIESSLPLPLSHPSSPVSHTSSTHRHCLQLLRDVRFGEMKQQFQATAVELLLPKDHQLQGDVMKNLFYALSPSETEGNQNHLVEISLETIGTQWISTLRDGNPVILSNFSTRNSSSDPLHQHILSLCNHHVTSAVLFPFLNSTFGLSILIFINLEERYLLETLAIQSSHYRHSHHRYPHPQPHHHQQPQQQLSEESFYLAYITPSLQDKILLIQKSSKYLKIFHQVIDFCLRSDQRNSQRLQFLLQEEKNLQLCYKKIETNGHLQMKFRCFSQWKDFLSRGKEKKQINRILSYCHSVNHLLNLSSTVSSTVSFSIEQFQSHVLEALKTFLPEQFYSIHTNVVTSKLVRTKERESNVIHEIIEDLTGQQVLSVEVTHTSPPSPPSLSHKVQQEQEQQEMKFQLDQMLVTQFCSLATLVLKKLQQPILFLNNFETQTDPMEEDLTQVAMIPFLNRYLPAMFPQDLLASPSSPFSSSSSSSHSLRGDGNKESEIADRRSVESAYQQRFSQIANEMIHFMTETCHADLGILRLNSGVGSPPAAHGFQFISKDTIISSEDPSSSSSSSSSSSGFNENSMTEVVSEMFPRHERKKRDHPPLLETKKNQINLHLPYLNGELQLLGNAEYLLSEKEKQFVSLLLYLLTISATFHHLKIVNTQLQQELQQLHLEVRQQRERAQRLIRYKEQTAADHHKELMAIRKMSIFSCNFMKLTSLHEISNEIYSNLSVLFPQVTSAAIYLRVDKAAGGGERHRQRGEEEDEDEHHALYQSSRSHGNVHDPGVVYHLFPPSLSSSSSTSSMGGFGGRRSAVTEFESIISENQMKKIPSYAPLRSSAQSSPVIGKISSLKRSKLLLSHSQSPSPLGMILLIEDRSLLLNRSKKSSHGGQEYDEGEGDGEEEERGMEGKWSEERGEEKGKEEKERQEEYSLIQKSFSETFLHWTSQLLWTLRQEKDLQQNFISSEKYLELKEKSEEVNEHYEALREETSDLMEVHQQYKLETETEIGKYKKCLNETERQLEELQRREELEREEKNNLLRQRDEEREISQQNSERNLMKYSELKEAYQSLETLVMGYAIDSRFQPQHIVSWLYEIAEGMNLTIIPIHRGNRGEYFVTSTHRNLFHHTSTGTSTKSTNTSSMISTVSLTLSNAIRESLRTCTPIEIIGSQNDIFLNSTGTGTSLGTSTTSIGNPNKFLSHHHVMLCIPNRLAGSGLSGELSESRESVCYIFVKDNTSRSSRHEDTSHTSFSDSEKSYLNCAVGLITKCLAVTTIARRKYPENVEQLIQKTEIEKENSQRMSEAIQVGVKFSSQYFHSWNNFVKAVENIIPSILFPPSSSSSLPTPSSWSATATTTAAAAATATAEVNSLFVIESYVWQPGLQSDAHEYIRSSFDSIRGSLENDALAHRVMANGRSQRNGNVMWIPLKLSSGKTIALLYVEKKIDLRYRHSFFETRQHQKSDQQISSSTLGVEEKREPGLGHEHQHLLGSLTDGELIFSESDEEIMKLFSILLTASLDRLVHQKETLKSVQTASKAILTLQQSQLKLETAMAMEIAHKLKLEEAIQVGSDILSTSFLQR